MLIPFHSISLLTFIISLLLFSATNIIIFYLFYIFFHLARTNIFFFILFFSKYFQRLCFKLRDFSKNSLKHREHIRPWYKIWRSTLSCSPFELISKEILTCKPTTSWWVFILFLSCIFIFYFSRLLDVTWQRKIIFY